eukprot:TRINITY_DN12679_c1_g1_i3.p1 TRINITY_DN12679_c1_g1~~TRINITY_DN12679_c1_g1_i3.p1  ORF type:complete len:706 (-),score=129.07 TRINITY_DN12679_c1_g1_i3:72-2135(-)
MTDAWPKDLPTELRGLSEDGLTEISGALAVLGEAGLSEIRSVNEIEDKLKAGLEANEDLMTTYMKMNEWASTPAKWKATNPPAEGTGWSLSKVGQEEAEAKRTEKAAERDALMGNQGNQGSSDFATEVDAIKEKAKGNRFKAWRLVGKRYRDMGEPSKMPQNCFDFFKAFLDNYVTNNEERLALESQEPSKPLYLGDGPGVLFSPNPMQGKSKPLPPLRRRRLAPTQDLEKVDSSTLARPVSSVVTLHIGGVGCNIGLSLWDRLCAEHRVCVDSGVRSADTGRGIVTHFDETLQDKFVPRAIFVDVDRSTLQDSSQFSNRTFAPCDLLAGSGLEQRRVCSDYYSQELRDMTLESLRAQAEKADSLSCLLITHSIANGFGSGFAIELFRNLSTDFGKLDKVCLTHVPSPESASDDSRGDKGVVNSVFALDYLLEHIDLKLFVDNAALRKVVAAEAPSPANTDLNQICARLLATLTSPKRLPNSSLSSGEAGRHLSVRSAMTNLIPYPRIAIAVPTLHVGGKLSSVAHAQVDEWNTFSQGAMASVDLAAKDAKYVAGALYSRAPLGQTNALSQHYNLLDKVPAWANLLTRVDWVPNSFLVGSHNEAEAYQGGEAIGIHNHSGVGKIFEGWKESTDSGAWDKVRDVYCVEDSTQGEWYEAVEGLNGIISDYKEMQAETAGGAEEEEEEEE